MKLLLLFILLFNFSAFSNPFSQISSLFNFKKSSSKKNKYENSINFIEEDLSEANFHKQANQSVDKLLKNLNSICDESSSENKLSLFSQHVNSYRKDFKRLDAEISSIKLGSIYHNLSEENVPINMILKSKNSLQNKQEQIAESFRSAYASHYGLRETEKINRNNLSGWPKVILRSIQCIVPKNDISRDDNK